VLATRRVTPAGAEVDPDAHVSSVRVGRFLSRAEAEVARGLLVTNGVPAVVLGDDGGGVHPDISYGYGGVALGVHPDDVDEAENLLGDIDAPIDRSELRSAGWKPLVMVLLAAIMAVLVAAVFVQGSLPHLFG
jgi:hypothetical protein